jgi:hypothetical protein
MAKVEVYRCDECGAEKNETNHWFLIGCGGELFVSRWTAPVLLTHTATRSTSAANSAPTKSYRSGWRE